MASQTDPDRPLDWANCDSLWGGELFKADETSTKLGIKEDDEFRIEKMTGKLTLVPKPRADHEWVHDKNNPVELTPTQKGNFRRAYSMKVTFKGESDARQLYFVESNNFNTRIQTASPETDKSNGGSANLRR